VSCGSFGAQAGADQPHLIKRAEYAERDRREDAAPRGGNPWHTHCFGRNCKGGKGGRDEPGRASRTVTGGQTAGHPRTRRSQRRRGRTTRTRSIAPKSIESSGVNMIDGTSATTERADRLSGAPERVYPRERLHHVSWGAIFLGLAIAIGLQILLSLLGLAIGLFAFDPADPAGMQAWGIGTSLYVIATQIISLFTGGFVASRLSPARTDQSALIHGASIWALATIIMVWFGSAATGMLISGVSGAASSVWGAGTQVVQAVVPDDVDIGFPELDYRDLPQPMVDALRDRGITPENLQQELQGAYRDVVTPAEQQQVLRQLQQGAAEMLRNPGDAPQVAEEAIDNIFGEGAILSEQDMEQLETTLQNRLNLSDQELQQITSQIEQAVEQTRRAAEEALTTARTQAVDVAEGVSDNLASIAFWTFVASLIGLIAAIAGGKVGEVKLSL
jgi:ElaB/YqjD/DUF883 family membrane-anchored ribosome-binding protein